MATRRSDIEAALKRLNAAANLPDGRSFAIESWAPGDGWRRYRLVLRLQNRTILRELGCNMHACDLIDALNLAEDILRETCSCDAH